MHQQGHLIILKDLSKTKLKAALKRCSVQLLILDSELDGSGRRRGLA